jgi:hypothetical protein
VTVTSKDSQIPETTIQKHTCAGLQVLATEPLDVARVGGDVLGVSVGDENRHSAKRMGVVANDGLAESERDGHGRALVDDVGGLSHSDLLLGRSQYEDREQSKRKKLLHPEENQRKPNKAEGMGRLLRIRSVTWSATKRL